MFPDHFQAIRVRYSGEVLQERLGACFAMHYPDVDRAIAEGLNASSDAESGLELVKQLATRCEIEIDDTQAGWVLEETSFGVTGDSPSFRRHVFLLLSDTRRPWVQKHETLADPP